MHAYDRFAAYTDRSLVHFLSAALPYPRSASPSPHTHHGMDAHHGGHAVHHQLQCPASASQPMVGLLVFPVRISYAPHVGGSCFKGLLGVDLAPTVPYIRAHAFGPLTRPSWRVR
jgi:hypothetical protein